MTEEQAQKVLEAAESGVQGLQNWVESMQEWAERFVSVWQEWAGRAMPKLVQAAERIKAILWEAYSEAGQPYGPTEDGMWRWFGELRNRAQREYEQWLREQMAIGPLPIKGMGR